MSHWTVTEVESPSGPSATVAVGDTMYCFGGKGAHDQCSDHIDVNAFDMLSYIWTRLTPAVTPGEGERPPDVPSRRCGHTAVLVGGVVYIWGGYDYTSGHYCNKLHAFDVEGHGWFKPEVSGSVPTGRYRHSACVLGKVMYIHGGLNQLTTSLTNDIHTLDTTTMAWSSIDTHGTPPPDSYCHSASIIGTKMFVFGGVGDHGHYNTIRVFDTETDSWLRSTPPVQLLPDARCDHSSFAYNGELYIYGGKASSLQAFNDLWKFKPETFSWKLVELEESRERCPCCCSMVEYRIMVFGHMAPEHVYMLDFSSSWMDVMEPLDLSSSEDVMEEPVSRERRPCCCSMVEDRIMGFRHMEPEHVNMLDFSSSEDDMEPLDLSSSEDVMEEPVSRERPKGEVVEPSGSWCVLS